jgi:hypothetical protein
MTCRQIATLVLMVVVFPLGEFDRAFSEINIEPWLDKGYHYVTTLPYYVNKICDLIIPIAQWFIIWMWVRRVLILEIGAWVNIVYTLYDLFMFLVNHNMKYDYSFIYTCIGLIAFLVYVARNQFHTLSNMQYSLKNKIERGYQ